MEFNKKDSREPCKYGADCYQKNPFHLSRYKHPKKRSGDDVSVEDSKAAKKIKNDVDESKSVNKSGDEIPSKSTCDASEPIIHSNPGDIQSNMKQLFLVDMPSDLYEFFDFCQSKSSKNPLLALTDVDLTLVGPFELLSGRINNCTESQAIRHYRFYFDPPEFQTLAVSKTSEFHIGYFRDSPSEPPSFVASNDSSQNCLIQSMGGNLFAALNTHINNVLKTCDVFKKIKLQKLQKDLVSWAKSKSISLEANSKEMKSRRSKIVAKTFHGAGLVVPVDKETDLGYRPLAEDYPTLKRMFSKIEEDSDTSGQNSVHWNKLQPVITYANIATDECDFGTGLELGINMFCQGHQIFHKQALMLMTMGYNLLNRSEYSKIIEVHLANRIRGSELNFATSGSS